MNTFVAILTPIKQANSIEQYRSILNPKELQTLGEHFQYLEKLDESGKILLGGPCLDAQRLIIIVTANSLEEAEELIKNDPSVKNKLVFYEVHPFSISVGSLKSKI